MYGGFHFKATLFSCLFCAFLSRCATRESTREFLAQNQESIVFTRTCTLTEPMPCALRRLFSLGFVLFTILPAHPGTHQASPAERSSRANEVSPLCSAVFIQVESSLNQSHVTGGVGCVKVGAVQTPADVLSHNKTPALGDLCNLISKRICKNLTVHTFHFRPCRRGPGIDRLLTVFVRISAAGLIIFVIRERRWFRIQ